MTMKRIAKKMAAVGLLGMTAVPIGMGGTADPGGAQYGAGGR